MKNKYIELLHDEIQKLESKVASLKDNQNVSFSFFRESFKQTQEIMRLLHELEFVQIEDMKCQMEKLVHFLSETETSTPKTSEELEKMEERREDSKRGLMKNVISDIKDTVAPASSISSSKDIPKEETKEDLPQLENKKQKTKDIADSNEILQRKGFVKEDAPVDSINDPLSATNKSLNDVLPTNHTILDTKQSISLNDRFLFQRELFDNDRAAMNTMMTRMQEFKTYEERELYLKENTDWNFKDVTVEKFLEMLRKNS